MLAPSEVLVKARVYLGEVIPEFAALEPKVDEMVLTKDSSKWEITFIARSGGNPKAETVADLLSNPRIEKVISVTADDGSLVAVRNPSY
jgi:phage pi2 protein 07